MMENKQWQGTVGDILLVTRVARNPQETLRAFNERSKRSHCDLLVALAWSLGASLPFTWGGQLSATVTQGLDGGLRVSLEFVDKEMEPQRLRVLRRFGPSSDWPLVLAHWLRHDARVSEWVEQLRLYPPQVL